MTNYRFTRPLDFAPQVMDYLIQWRSSRNNTNKKPFFTYRGY